MESFIIGIRCERSNTSSCFEGLVWFEKNVEESKLVSTSNTFKINAKGFILEKREPTCEWNHSSWQRYTWNCFLDQLRQTTGCLSIYISVDTLYTASNGIFHSTCSLEIYLLGQFSKSFKQRNFFQLNLPILILCRILATRTAYTGALSSVIIRNRISD